MLLLARDEARLTEIAARCEAKGARAVTASVDVREKEKLATTITQMDDETPIDLVIANAGISTGTFAGTESLEAAEAVFDVNVMGVVHTIHPLLPRLLARGRGQVAIMASLAGICPLPGAPAYSASKAAVLAYGDALRGKFAVSGVHVSVICPGWIATPLTDKNDFPMPWMMSASRAANIIQRNLEKKKSRIAFPRRLYFLLRLLAMMPISLRDAVLTAIPEKS